MSNLVRCFSFVSSQKEEVTPPSPVDDRGKYRVFRVKLYGAVLCDDVDLTLCAARRGSSQSLSISSSYTFTRWFSVSVYVPLNAAYSARCLFIFWMSRPPRVVGF